MQSQQSREQLSPVVPVLSQVALCYTLFLLWQIWHEPVGIVAHVTVTALCIWHSRVLTLLARPLTVKDHDALLQAARVETKDTEATIYSGVGVAFWNWIAVILASNALRHGFGWGTAALIYLGFVAISQFLLTALLLVGLGVYRVACRVLGI